MPKHLIKGLINHESKRQTWSFEQIHFLKLSLHSFIVRKLLLAL